MAYKDKSKAMKYQNEFNKTNYDRVTIMLPKGCKDKLKSLARENGVSVNEYVKQAIQAYSNKAGSN